MLGSCYMNGWGVTQDFGKAVEWLAKSEPANEKSRAILSLCHAFGIGVKRDLNKAVELRSRVGIRSEQEWLDRYLEAATRVVEPSTRPVPVFQDQPRYPFGLAREGIEGRVFVRFVVDRDGFVLDAHVGESTRSEFEAPALVAISCWRFAPLEGKDSVKMEIPISFKLNKESKNAQESEP
jgi:TonB family protein